MSRDKKKCNCSCRCKSPQLPLVLVPRRAFPRIDGLDNMGPFPVFEKIGRRRVNARTAFLDYLSDTGLIDRGNFSPGSSIGDPTANNTYGVL